MGSDRPKFKEIFILFKSERKQFIVLTVIVSLLILARYTRPYWYQTNTPTIEQLESRVTIEHKKRITDSVKQTPKIPIDINLADNLDWQQLGFSVKQAHVIVQYRKKINGFKSINAVSNVFIIDSTKFDEIRPFLRLNKVESYIKENTKIQSKEPVIENSRSWNLSTFDPNTITKIELMEMGFNDSEISNIINYRDKVGLFVESTDFKKLYVFSDFELQKVMPFVFVTSMPEPDIDTIPEKMITDINLCDSLFLISIKGIGPYYAKLIISYRERLGGFIDVDQLYEINKIPSETIDLCISRFKIADGFEPRKMDVNSKDFKMFMRHPYFSYAHTKKIFDYRNLKGNYASLQQLKNINFIDSKYVERVSPYLKVE